MQLHISPGPVAKYEADCAFFTASHPTASGASTVPIRNHKIWRGLRYRFKQLAFKVFFGKGIAGMGVVKAEAQKECVGNLPLYCKEREQLRMRFLEAIHVMVEVLAEQADAVVAQEDDFVRIDGRIHSARLAKEIAKYTLIEHLTEHQCHRTGNLLEHGLIDSEFVGQGGRGLSSAPQIQV